jgi:Undecaprenyl-phosphate glucose phosphotransferase
MAAVELLSAGMPYSVYHSPTHILVALMTVLLWMTAAEYYRVCSVDELFREWTGIRAASSACFITYSLLIALVFFTHLTELPRRFLLLNAILLFCFTLIVHSAFRIFVRNGSGRRKPLNVVIVGTDHFARRAVQRMDSTPFLCHVVAYVQLPNQPVQVADAPLFDLDQLDQLSPAKVDDILIALPPERFGELPAIIRRFDRLCLPIRAIVDFGDNMFVRERLFQFGRLQLLDLARTPAESLAYTVIKRAFDITFASLALLVFSPLMAIAATAIKLTSPGPVLFRQQRVGLNGHIFSMLKFRTMKVTAPAESDTRWTTENDPRRTRIGSLLRKTSLDELPQFFNVLKGEMSVVGPRPERPHFVSKFLEDVQAYNSRHRLKVGITGWAQVNGWRGDTSINKRVEYDLYYLQNWSLAFDLRIIFLTVWSVLFSRNAY